jgi:hypothetical protein
VGVEVAPVEAPRLVEGEVLHESVRYHPSCRFHEVTCLPSRTPEPTQCLRRAWGRKKVPGARVRVCMGGTWKNLLRPMFRELPFRALR